MSYDRYRAVHERSVADPEGFWMEAADGIDWIEKPSRALDMHEDGSWTWFPGGVLNTSYNALDRHIDAGLGNKVALIYDSAMTGAQRAYSYRELRHEVAVFAGALRRLGVEKGDRVVIYMPMIPEAVIAMLATARIGAIHSVVFGGFASNELASRLADAKPKVIVTSSGGLEPGKPVEYLPLAAKALELAPESGVQTVVVVERSQVPGTAAEFDGRGGARWIEWDAANDGADPADPVPVESDHPLYILYTSGTTGVPKGIVRDNGGHAVALNWSIPNVYGLDQDEVFWAASDIGWAVGHSYTVYGPLLAGATSVLYEGKPVGTPDAGAFWRVVADHRVNVLFTAPTAARAIRRVDPELTLLPKYDTSTLKAFFLAGERLDPETYHWIEAGLGRPVVDHWWQTETGWPISAIARGIAELPGRAGSANFPMPGYQVEILDDRGNRIEDPNAEGNIAIRTPMAPGNLLGIWGAPKRYREAYLSVFPAYYSTGDSGYFDKDGYLYVMGRTDDVINVAGHRLSTGALEEVLIQHDAVAECAVVGIKDELKGQRAAGFVVLKAGHDEDTAALAGELVQLVREQVGPVAAFKDVVIVERLPKTRSGKILRKNIRQLVDGEPVAVPPTIEDSTVIDDLRALLERQPITAS